LYEISVVASEAEEFVDFSNVPRSDPFFDVVYLCLFHLDCSSPDAYAEEVQVVLFEYALLGV